MIFRIFSAVMGYRLERAVHWPKTLPMNYTFSVTNRCNSKCRTCFIWKFHKEKQNPSFSELTIEEYDKLFSYLKKSVVWATISGGEPYLREDLAEICKSLQTNCAPFMINLATNGLLPDIVRENTRKILQNCRNTFITVNLSLDGIGVDHDEIRGIPGNFDRALETYAYLKDLKGDFPNLRVGIHSVISRFNIHSLPRLCSYIHNLAPDSYVTEVAETRSELFNMDQEIAPGPEEYGRSVKYLLDNMRRNSHHLTSGTSRLINAFRMCYYEMAAKELQMKKQVIPCYAGYASAQIAPNGDVWPCSVLGHDRIVGNLREYKYDFKALWRSKETEETRRWIKDKHCHCPLANAHYTNIICNPTMTLKLLGQYLRNSL